MTATAPVSDASELHALRSTVRELLADRGTLKRAREQLEAATPLDRALWAELAGSLGLGGLLAPEEHGGAGAGLAEAVVVLEELGRGLYEGLFLSSAVVGTTVLRGLGFAAGGDLLRSVAAGERTVAVVATDGRGRWVGCDGGLTVTGDTVTGSAGYVLGAPEADVLLVAARDPDGPVLLGVDPSAAGVTRTPQPTIDATYSFGSVELASTRGEVLARGDAVAAALAVAADVGAVAVAAELVGAAQACLEMSVGYAKLRHAFGRPIGSFQAVKHHCAAMLVAVEAARSVVTAAVREHDAGGDVTLLAAAAKARAAEVAVDVAARTIQVHGGIGYTWEHDAHLYYRRAYVGRRLFGDPHEQRARIAALLLAGAGSGDRARSTAATSTGDPQLAEFRGRLRAWLAEVAPQEGWGNTRGIRGDVHNKQEKAKRAQALLADAGYAAITWPTEYGGGGRSSREQIAFYEETADYDIPSVFAIGLGMTGPTILELGTAAQRQRWIPPLVRGEHVWCQLFSEPAAGSDVAGLETRAERVEGGWVVNGQKVWTSYGPIADWGLLLARTDPSVPKHAGLTMFVVDMHAPGVQVRPLRQMGGDATFSEVFFEDVHVPDDQLIGDVGGGWRAAIVTLMNERASIGAGSMLRSLPSPADLLADARAAGLEGDSLTLDQVADVYVAEQVVRGVGDRITSAVLAGQAPGPEGSIAKVVFTDYVRRATDVATRLRGLDGLSWQAVNPLDESQATSQLVLTLPNWSIAGGTDEILLNIIGERVLGLPREPAVDRDMPFRERNASTR